jgi:hypothetical protein
MTGTDWISHCLMAEFSTDPGIGLSKAALTPLVFAHASKASYQNSKLRPPSSSMTVIFGLEVLGM